MQKSLRGSRLDGRDRLDFTGILPVAALSVAFGIVVTGCTPATDTQVAGTGGGSQSTGGAVGNGTGGSAVPGSGGATLGTGGGGEATGGSSVLGSGGAAGGPSAGTGGTSAGTGGAAGQSSTGTGGQATGSGGAGGGGTASKGCWNTADGKYAAGATLRQDGKVVLFDGTDMKEWRKEGTTQPSHWRITPEKTMEVVPAEPPTDLQTIKTFEDLCVHVEYMTPMVTSADTGQNRGNSGVYLKSAYEMQILDSVGFPIDINTCGAVYSVRAPIVSACNKQEVWNTYEIEFKASRWGASTTKPDTNASFVLVTLNGTVVQRDVPIDKIVTEAGNPDRPGPQSLMLQDHRWRVQFRNIWVKVPQY